MAAAERILAYRRTLQDATAERCAQGKLATGFFCDSLRDIYDLNYLYAEAASPAAELTAEADLLMEAFHHRKVVVEDGGARLARDFEQLGWTVTPHLVMAHAREPDRRVDTAIVEEVPFDDVVPARTEVTLSEPWGDEPLAHDLNEAKRRVIAATPTRFFAARVDGRVAAYCELRSGEGVAQIEDVNTMPALRGRGLGRAVVQRALDAGRASHDVVFLDALAEDWPRELYAKLGFDVVGERHLFLRYPHAWTRLRLRTPRLELRLPTVAELRALAEVAREGVHAPGEMPFEVAWTDNARSPSFVDGFVEYHLGKLRESRPDHWRIELAAFLDGQPVGVQGIGADDFALEREVFTGSWLGARWQRRGLGTEMRSAVLALAFDGLGARTALSAAWERNDASLGVSRRLGYVETGTKLASPRGEPLVHRTLRVERERFRPAVETEIVGLERLRSSFGAD